MYQGILSGNAVPVIIKTLTRNSVSMHSLETLSAGVQSLHIFKAPDWECEYVFLKAFSLRMWCLHIS
jgi:hypothetical protein